MGEWRRGKWVRWLSSTQKVAQSENSELTASASQAPSRITERPKVKVHHKSYLSAVNLSRNRPVLGGGSASLHAKSGSIFVSEMKYHQGDCLDGSHSASNRPCCQGRKSYVEETQDAGLSPRSRSGIDRTSDSRRASGFHAQ